MTVLPVVAREMSVLARRKSTYWARAITGFLAVLVMLWLLIVSRAHLTYAALGSSIFLILSSLCFTFTVLVGMHATADSLSEEKREGTLGLLFLTDLKGTDIVGGKLAATSLHAVLALIGVIPMLSIALLLGGVTLEQFGRVALVLINTMFFSLSLGVFVSSISKNERKAMGGTFLGLLLLVLGPFVLAYVLSQRIGLSEELMAISPLYAFGVVQNAMGPRVGGPQFYWVSVIATHLLAWFFLLFAAWILPRCVNDLPAARFAGVRNFVQNFVFGRAEQRRQHRAELLDRNAFLWLASRERVKPKYAWGVIFFFAGLYLWIAMQFDNLMFDLLVSSAIMFLVYLVFKIWAASEVCSRLIQDRRSGALELLLSTPLSVKAIAVGQTKALGRLFFYPIVFLIALELILLFGGLRHDNPSTRTMRLSVYAIGITTFLLDLWALKWVGLWLSLTGKSMERVLIATLTRVLLLPWLLFVVLAGLLGTIAAMGGELQEPVVLWLWAGIAVTFSFWFGAGARRKFLAQFRDLASGRFESVPAPEPTRKKARIKQAPFYKRHPVTASFAAFLIGLFVVVWARGQYWSYRVEAEVSRVRTQGLPITERDVVRYYPNVPRSENAFAVLEDSGPVIWNRGSFPTRKNATNILKEELDRYRQFLAGNSSALKAMWKLTNYNRGWIDRVNGNPWMQQHLQAGYMAVADADLMETLHRDGGPDVDRVKQDIHALMAHARLLREQPLAFLQKNAEEALRRLCNGLEIVFAKNVLDETSLISIQRELERVDKTNMLAKTIAMQRVFYYDLHQDPNATYGMRIPVPAPLAMLQVVYAGSGSRDKALVASFKKFDEALILAQSSSPDRLTNAASAQPPYPAFAWMGIPGFIGDVPSTFANEASFVAHLNLLRAGVAAKRYQQKHGRLPETLHALVPEFLPTVPGDPFSGQPLNAVHRSNFGLVIYSVGLNQIDDTAGNEGVTAMDFRIIVK